MATIFSYDQSEDTMSRIKTARGAINEVFADCDKVSSQLQENIQTVGVSGNQDVSQAALNAYESLKKHYEEFINLTNEQNIVTHSQNMQAAQSQSASAMENAQAQQDLQ
mgnify:CR=1 FL=1